MLGRGKLWASRGMATKDVEKRLNLSLDDLISESKKGASTRGGKVLSFELIPPAQLYPVSFASHGHLLYWIIW